MFSSRLPLSALIELCRVLRHYLGAGLALPDVFRQQEKRGPSAVRAAAGRIAGSLETGDALEQALKKEAKLFPPLFLSLASVGERTGMLPEVFSELEKYYLRQKKLRQTFIALSAWPIIQFVLAVLIVALVLFVLGQIGTGPDGKPAFDPLGLGLTGGSGALIFMGAVFGSVGAVLLLYFVLGRVLGGRARVDRFLLGVPALGPCLEALALARFCLALRLTTESGMSIVKALRLSLRATGNSAFVAEIPTVEEAIERGEDLTLALAGTRLLPDDFERMIGVAEESGQLAEVLRHQGDHYHEEASRRLTVLTAVAGWGVWGLTAVFIIALIFAFYLSYLRLLGSFLT
jgi:type II secretory pathway component PulF